MLTTSRPLLGLLSLPKTNRARWYGSSARTSDLLIGHQRDHNVKQFVARESPDLRGGKYHQQQRRHLFSATRPTNQSSHENVRPGQRIVINPTGGSSDNRKKSSHKNKKNKLLQRSAQPVFIDRIHLKMRGGSGGAGGLSYFKMGSFKQRPCGGHGGTGGNVYLVTDSTLSSLKMERHHYTGQDGGRGGNSGMNGKNGKDVFVRVPCGVVVRKVLDWEEVEEFYGGEAHSLEEIDLGKDDSEDLAHVDVVSNEDSVEEEENNTDIGFEAHSLEEIDPGEDDSEDLAHVDVVSNEANNIDIENSLGQEDHQIDEQTASPEIDEEDGDAIDGEKDGNIEEEVEEDFDTYLERQQSSKRHRKRQRKGRGYLPSDYEEVVDQEVRSEDGMFHWSTLATNDTYDDDGNLMASTAYPGYQYGPSNPMRKTVLMADLDQPDSSLLVAEGGRAGVGNQAYARRPYFAEREANAAKKSVAGVGETTYLELELKLIADVGLVGFPNAGKSSLLSAMSKARPKIASYPFTTLLPLVGSIHYKDGYSIVMADVPGLIDGAAEGRGRGFEFLRHIERTKALVYMVDAAGVDGRDPVSDLKILGNELREYGSSGIFGENEMGGDEGEYGEEVRRRRREIMNRPSLILANKMDLIPEIDAGMGRREELLFELGNAAMEVGIVCESDDILGISAGVTGEGLQVLSKRMRQVVKDVESS